MLSISGWSRKGTTTGAVVEAEAVNAMSKLVLSCLVSWVTFPCGHVFLVLISTLCQWGEEKT